MVLFPKAQIELESNKDNRLPSTKAPNSDNSKTLLIMVATVTRDIDAGFKAIFSNMIDHQNPDGHIKDALIKERIFAEDNLYVADLASIDVLIRDKNGTSVYLKKAEKNCVKHLREYVMEMDVQGKDF